MADAEPGRRKAPAFQWYPGDFRRDTAVQACSFEARSLWREMIDLMHDGEPYGHMTAGGVPITVEQLGRLIGKPPRVVRQWMQELEDRKVFSRNENGVIFSRRMIRDEDIRRRRAAGGHKGGNPALMGGGKVEDKVNLAANLQPTPAVCSLQSAVQTTDTPNGGAAPAAPLVENPLKEWLGTFMPMLRECGFEADDTDGSILKHWHKRGYTRDEVEAAIRGLAAIKARGGLSAFANCKLSLRLLYARPKPDAPPERRPLWNDATELYHRTQERGKRADPNAGNAIANILERIARNAEAA